MFPINQFKIEVVSESKTEGKFRISPLPKGYGETMGNTLRRILLSSIPGAAVTSVKLAGVEHEYTTLAGLSDDVLSVVLGLKGIAVLSYTDEPVTLALHVKGEKGGPRKVTAGDIEKNPLIEIVNEDYVITTLSDEKSVIEAEITIRKGVGYALPEEGVRKELGNIPVDAIYNPVRNVAISATNARVGQQTDLDALEITIFTNGAISPSAALFQASEITQSLAEHLVGVSSEMVSGTKKEALSTSLTRSTEEVGAEEAGVEPLKVETLNLSTRLTNALMNAGFSDLRELNGLTEEEVAGMKGMGDKSYKELLEVLANNSIKLV